MSARSLMWGALDVCVSALVAYVFWVNVGVSGQSDTRPPTCTTASGHSVSCSLEGPLWIATLTVFVAVLGGLVAAQVVRGRRRARGVAVRSSNRSS